MQHKNYNATDELITAIAESGGIIGINGFPGFVVTEGQPTMDQFLTHLDHLVEAAEADEREHLVHGVARALGVVLAGLRGDGALAVHGGLIASGFHTGALVMRLLVDHFLSAVAGMGSPGLDEVRWPRPVRPGDRLRVRVTVEEAKRSRSKPDRGVVIAGVEARNQHGEPVMTFRATLFVACRH